MSRYTGIHCPVCDKVFTDSDDIVVCPECGAPHHRECYQKEGHCHFESEHGTRKSWNRPDEETINGANFLKCPKCGCENSPENIFCDICGTRLKDKPANESDDIDNEYTQPFSPIPPNPYTTPFGGLDPAEEMRGISIKDWAMFIGNRTFYFIPRFKAMQLNKFFINTNWAAFFTSFFYYFYRKMYIVGIALLTLFAISYIPTVYVVVEFLKSSYAAEGMNALMSIDIDGFVSFAQGYSSLLMFSNAVRNIAFLASTILSIFANKIYFHMAERKIKSLREKYKDDAAYSKALAKHGRTNKLAVAIVIGLVFFAFVIAPNIIMLMVIK